ncbi:MAG: helix-turn-helix domain-containing protein [Nitrososphaerota archaeon]|jgi:DNA-binding transcriptional ArsR family regulator|nr:helix-turn-helix domain-containing protein [Nitrososphaerota archaeon]MDG6943897.1 helix-turn-helix domain-containing protein [Nitrososphaerota archaeon]
MENADVLARELDALGHPLRLKIIAMLKLHGEMHMALLASRLGVSRALVKIHMKKLEQSGLVRSRVMLIPGQAKALRMYELLDFKITVDPGIILKEVNLNE